MNKLETYCNYFASLRRAPGAVWTLETRRRAPHKPLFLMAVMDLIARGTITSNFIASTDDLVELNELFTGYWRQIVPLSQKSSIAFPFSRLHNEPFWSLVPIKGKELDRAVINNISTVTQLRQVALGAQMDIALFQLIQNEKSRNILRATLLKSCFSDQVIPSLIEQFTINAEAFFYNQDLFARAHQTVVNEATEVLKYQSIARDQGFRRAVTSVYDHRCALCGVRIVTPEGHTVVDAAHIIPWSRSRIDDIRNGMALCKLCHWAFDEGMMGVSDNYDVITSAQIATIPNVPGFLLTLTGRGIIPPQDKDLWPAQQYLAEHRREWRL